LSKFSAGGSSSFGGPVSPFWCIDAK